MKKRIENSKSFSDNVKRKSLVILSISLILLISVSFVSASWFSNLFDGKAKTSGSAIQTQDNIPQIDLKDKCGFFCQIFTPPQDEPEPLPEPIPIEINGDGELNGDILNGESCEILDLEELYISPGNVGVEALNNRFIDFDDDEVLTIDETFSTQLKEGRSYLIPIPNQECYWEASYDNGELHMTTVCPVSE